MRNPELLSGSTDHSSGRWHPDPWAARSFPCHEELLSFWYPPGTKRLRKIPPYLDSPLLVHMYTHSNLHPAMRMFNSCDAMES